MFRNKEKLVLLLVFALFFCISGAGAVSAADTPVANYTSNVTHGSAPLSVQFNDTSTGNPTTWNWSFGDNKTSTDQNPVHTYTKAGTYNVSLTAFNEDGNSTLTQTNYITVLLNDVYVSTAGDDVTGDGTSTNAYATIQKGLNNAASGGTVHLKAGTYIETGNKNLSVTKNVAIVGEDASCTTINAENSGNIFIIKPGVTLTIANITLTNGNSTSHGGAIYNNGTLNVIDSIFTNNHATNNGGAIYSYGNLTVINSTFINNTSSGDGGAIYNIGNVTRLTGTFLNNTANWDGGAIYNGGNFTSLSDSTFKGNVASLCWGGAIFNNGNMNLSNSTFNGNSAVNGGAIYLSSGNLTAHYNSFKNNTATTSGNTIYNSIYNSNTINTEYNWWGSNDKPSSQIYGPVDYNNWLYMTITVSPTNITHGSTGSVIVSFNNIYNGTNVTSIDPINGHIPDGTIVTFSSTLGTFNPTTTTTDEGNATSTFTATDVNIDTVNAVTDNQTISTYINGIGTKISVNNVTSNAGNTVNLTATLTSINGTSVSGKNVTFTVNGTSYTATTDENGVATWGYKPINAGVYSIVANFAGDTNYGNSSKTGFLTAQMNDIYVSPTGNDSNGDGTKSNPFATIQQGINCVTAGGTLHLMAGTYTGTGNNRLNLTKNLNIIGENQSNTIINAEKSNNIFTINSGLTVTIANLILTNGVALNGSAIYNNGNLTMLNCTFTNNNANSQGGAIYNYQSSLTLSNCTFTNNIASNSFGGAIYNYQTNLTLSNCTFTSNTASNWGGAICNAYGSTLNMTNSTFSGNTATSQGGAIANVGINAILNGTNCIFTNNTAGNNGGVIYNNGLTTLHFNSFVTNTAPTGSAIYLAMGTVNAEYNWWGSNNNPSNQIYGALDYNNWIYMTIINSTTILKDSTGTVTVSFNNICNGTNVTSIDPINGHIPDGTIVTFSSSLGTLNPTTAVTANGTATAALTVNYSILGNVNAKTDNQTVSSTIYTTLPTVAANTTTGTYNHAQTVTLTATDDTNTTIYYTTDGTNPTTSSTIYTDPITIKNTTTLRYIAVDSANNTSTLYTQTYTIDTTAPNVTSNTTSGVYNTAQTVVLTSDDADSTIYYTTDGSDPQTSNTKTAYTGAITISKTTTLKYTAEDTVGNWETTNTQSYTIDTLKPTVTTNVTSGTYSHTQTVALTATDDTKTIIYYTTDGTNPTTKSKAYTGPITIKNTTTLRYIAVDSANNTSVQYTQTYTIDTTAPNVRVNVNNGTYNTTKVVTLKMNENGTIYYTTDGSAPTTKSKVYSGPITISNSTTLRYIAVDKAGNNSPTYTTKYVIDKVAPTIKTINPKNGATNISRSTNSTLIITFSENIKLYSKYWSGIYIKNSIGQKVGISKSIKGNTLTIKINSKKSANTWYTVYIPAGAVTDNIGNKFTKNYTSKFKTGK
jgi:predicted outer membrane repeat protein